MMEVVKVKDLRKTFHSKLKEEGMKGSIKSIFRPEYREVEALQGIDLNVAKGEVLAFIGPNGAGKSTTIKILTGILHPTDGTVEVLGFTPWKNRKKLAFKIGTVFGQKSQLWYHLPPMDSFRLLADIYEMEVSDYRKRLSYLVDVFEIEDLLKTPIRKLSLGQRIRCEIAGALIHSPEIVFLDEPTIGLDVVVKHKIRDLIKRQNQEEKTTIFLTSHDAGDIDKLCKRAIIVNKGTIVLNEPVKHLKYNYMSQKVIDVKLVEPGTVEIPGVKVVKSKEFALKLELDTSKNRIEDVIRQLLEQVRVEDITISDPPLEEIISLIYQDRIEVVNE